MQQQQWYSRNGAPLKVIYNSKVVINQNIRNNIENAQLIVLSHVIFLLIPANKQNN